MLFYKRASCKKLKTQCPSFPAGIQKISGLIQKLDPRFHEDDDFCKSLKI
jgi:hypothetical protein